MKNLKESSNIMLIKFSNSYFCSGIEFYVIDCFKTLKKLFFYVYTQVEYIYKVRLQVRVEFLKVLGC